MAHTDEERVTPDKGEAKLMSTTPSTAEAEQSTSHGSRKKKIALGVVAFLIVAIIALLVFVGNFLVNYAIGRSGDGGNRQVALEVEAGADEVTKTIMTNRIAQQEANEDFLEKHPFELVSNTNNEGLKLSGDVYMQDATAPTKAANSPAAKNSANHNWVIALHGYRGSSAGAVGLAQHYFDAGYNVLAPDLCACGDTEGDYVGMGWLDRTDILCWIDWIVEQDPQASIVLHGISMGAATTMMTAGEQTPDNVKAFVEDCGYTSVWDIFSSELNLRFHLPEFPVLYVANTISNSKAGYKFDEASALDQVAKCTKPMLFIHGTADNFIPYDMMDQLYQAKAGTDKKEVTSEGAGHGEAMYAMGDEYWAEVFSFLDQYAK